MTSDDATLPVEPAEAPDEENPALVAFLAVIRGRNELPAFVRNVENINVVALNPKARVQLLNDAITSDVGLTAKVLKLANSAIYASAGRAVQTVHQAILLLGFERMKDIAISASVFDHLQQRNDDLRELMACSVLTANQALVLSSQVGFARAEVAYLCGIFRNLGEVVCATYAPDDYARYAAEPKAEDDPGATAQRAIFGFRFDELGRAIGAEWGLPDAITATIARPPALPAGCADGPGTLSAIVQLASDLTDAVYRSEPTEQRGRLRQTLERYGRGLGVEEKEVVEVARAALAESKVALRSANAGVDPSAFVERLDALRDQVAPATSEERSAPRQPFSKRLIGGEARPSRATGAWVIGGEADVPAPSLAEVARTAAQFDDAVRSERPMTMDEAIVRTLGALLGMGYQRAALLLAADGYTRLRVRTALGEGHEYLRDGIVVTLAPPNGALALALLRGDDVIADIRGTSKFRVDPTVKRLRSASVAALPVEVAGHAIGALFADHMRLSLDQGPQFRAAVIGVRDALQHAFVRLRELASQSAAEVGPAPAPAPRVTDPDTVPRVGAA